MVLSRLSAANSYDRLIEEPDNRGPDKRGCTVDVFQTFSVITPGRQGLKMVNVPAFEKMPYSRLHHCDPNRTSFWSSKTWL